MVRITHWDSEALTAQEHCPAWSRGWRHGAGRVTRCNGSALLCSLWPRGSHTTWTCLVRDICSLSAIFSWSIPVLCHRTASNQAHICIKLMSDCKLDFFASNFIHHHQTSNFTHEALLKGVWRARPESFFCVCVRVFGGNFKAHKQKIWYDGNHK